MPYNSETSQYERRATTVIDATPDGDTVAVAIDTKLDLAADDAVVDLNHHMTNGRHYPATSSADNSRFLKQSPAGVVSWANGVPLDQAVESTLLAASDGADLVGYGAGATVKDRLDAISASGGSSLVGFLQDGTGATARTVQAKLRDVVSVKDFGAIGDGVTDDTAAFRLAVASIQDNDSLYIPPGEYTINLTDSDVTDTGLGRAHAFLFVENKDNIKIFGHGKIKVSKAAMTSAIPQVMFFAAKDCRGVVFEGLTVEGNMAVSTSVPHDGNQSSGGVLLHNCLDGKILNNTFYKTQIPVYLSGYPKSPALSSDVTSRVVVSGNTFEFFEQCTTYGGAASEVIVTNNTFHNYFTGFKLSSKIDGAFSSANVTNYIFSGNTFTHDVNFAFPEISWNLGFAWSPNCIMVESAADNVVISNNVMDLSRAPDITRPAATTAACIIFFARDANNVATNYKITDNIMHAYVGTNANDHHALRAHTSAQNVEISGNKVAGRLVVSGGSNQSLEYNISNNTIYSIPTKTAAYLAVDSGIYRSLSITDNRLLGDPATQTLGYEALMFLTGFTATELNISNNLCRRGGISTFGSAAIIVNILSAVGNIVETIDFNTTGLQVASIVGNTLRGDVAGSRAIRLVMDAGTKANANIRIAGNVCSNMTGGNRTRAVDLNGGRVSITGNSFSAASGSAFIFDSSVFIERGSYYGNGAPAQSALFGVTYENYYATSDAVWMKTTSSGSTGWKLIQTAP